MPKVVVVTGAARGIGLATAKKFLSEGWRVALLDIDGETQDLARNALNEPDNTLAFECDVSEPDQVAVAIKEVVAEFGHIDALVNNAGIALFKPVMQTSLEEWSRVLAVNLNGPFICTQA